jgi:hypothetical protein
MCEDNDGDGHGRMPCGDDCDDNDANRYPGNPEVCAFDAASMRHVDPTHDEDCTATTFASAASHDGDQDHDGHIDRVCCNVDDSGGLHCGDDCADLGAVTSIAPFTMTVPAASIHPAQPEVCNGVDDNCSDTIDESLPLNAYSPDCDGDTYGDATSTPQRSCSVDAFPACSGHPVVPNAGDCDDTNPAIHVGATEVCDTAGVDENCDGAANPTCACTGTATQFCCNNRGTQSCMSGAWGPCSVVPATETCNGVDEDCNGAVDDLPGAESGYMTSRNNPICGVYACEQACGSGCRWASTCTLGSTSYHWDAGTGTQTNGGAVPCGPGLVGVCSGGAQWTSYWVFAPSPSPPLPPGGWTAAVGAAVGSTSCDITIQPIVTFSGGMWNGTPLAPPATVHFDAGFLGSRAAHFDIGTTAGGIRPCDYNMTFEIRGTGTCAFFRLIDFAITRDNATLDLTSL